MSDIFRTSYKVIILGQGQVGKSSLIKRFVQDKFELSIPMSTGMNEYTKLISIGDQNIVLHLWDTAGQEAYQSIVPLYFKGCKAAIVVYDITNELSFKKVSYWLEQVKELAPSDSLIMMIGNKVDLEEQRAVPKKVAIDLAKNFNMLYFETSCLTAHNVELAFLELGNKLSINCKVNGEERFESAGGRKLVMSSENRTGEQGGCCKGGKSKKR